MFNLFEYHFLSKQRGLETPQQVPDCTDSCSLFRFIILIFIVLSFACVGQGAVPVVLDLGNGVDVALNPFGAIEKISTPGTSLVARSQIFLQKQKGTIYQGAEYVPESELKISSTKEETKVQGVLLGEQSQNAEKVATFSVSYKKLANGVLGLTAEITYLTDASWQIPAQFTFTFPLPVDKAPTESDYSGASIVVVDHENTERSYKVSDKVLAFTGYGFTSASIEKNGRSVTVQPQSNTVLSLQDGRSFGANYLKVSLAARQPEWKSPFAFAAGTKQSFSGNVTFQSAK